MLQLSLDEPVDRSSDPEGEQRSLLTEEQELAVTRRSGSLLLSAAAGSGKTSVLVERYCRAVLEDGIAPHAILAITFTERAARELEQRIRARLHQCGRREIAGEVERAPIGTFHGFCAQLLAVDPLAAGLTPGFRILDEAIAAHLRIDAFACALRTAIPTLRPLELDLLAGYGADRLRAAVLGAHAQLRSRGCRAPRLPEPLDADAPEDVLAAHTLLARLLTLFDDAYESRKRLRDALDFDDLELYALQLLQEDGERSREWAERFEMLLVDEFQDTNPRQLALLRALERDNLFTVGDEWQSIYSFRHADVEIFRRREAELSDRGAWLALRSNFRSRPGVISAVNVAFAVRFGERFAPLRAARKRGEGGQPAVELMICDADGCGQTPDLRHALAQGLPSAPSWRQAEARLVASRIAQLVADGRAQPGDIAVLLRAGTDIALYDAALRACGLPTCCASAELWDAPETHDLICHLRVILNPLDDLALCSVLSGPAVGLSMDALALLAGAARDARIRLWQLIADRAHPSQASGEWVLAAQDRRLLEGFGHRLVDQRERASELSLPCLLDQLADEHGGEPRSGEPAASVRRPTDIARALSRLAAEFEATEGRDLRGFLGHLDHLAQIRAAMTPQSTISDGALDAVRLMSIHAAKGLEFPVVCVADLGRVSGGQQSADLLLDEQRVGLRVMPLDGGAARPALDYEQIRAERQRAEEQEEDRILYVGMTRAQELLLLAGAASFSRWPAASPGCAPIAWLAGALVEDLPQRLSLAAQGHPTPARREDPSGGHEDVACLLAGPADVVGLVSPPESGQRGETSADDGRRSANRGGEQAVAAGSVLPATRPSLLAVQPPLPTPRSSLPTSPLPIPPHETGQNLSYTALALWEHCGYRFYLERVLGMPPDPAVAEGADRPYGDASEGPGRNGGVERARAFGELAHVMLEEFDFSRRHEVAPRDVARAARRYGMRLQARAYEQLAAMLTGMGDTDMAHRLGRARQRRFEQRFCFALRPGGPLISGAFDLIASEPGGTRIVVDYKTGSVPGPGGEDLESLTRREYGLQQLIYASAAMRAGAQRVEVAHWFLHRPRSPVSVCWQADESAQLQERLEQRIERIRQSGYAVSEHPNRRLCAACPGRVGLCSWPLEATMRKATVSALPSAG